MNRSGVHTLDVMGYGGPFLPEPMPVFFNTGPYHSEIMILNILQQEANKESHLITPHDYEGFKDEYSQSAVNNQINAHGYNFSTRSLRTGYIQNEFIVLSPTKIGEGKAYIDYALPLPIDEIEMELAYWSNAEGKLTSLTFKYLDTNNKWNYLDLLTALSITNDRSNPNKFKKIFSTPIIQFGIEANSDVNKANNSYKGRICITSVVFDLSVWRAESQFTSLAIEYFDGVRFVTVTPTIHYNALSTTKTEARTFSATFNIPVTKFRIYATAPATGSSNDARIVVSKVKVAYN